ncbi:Cyanide-insensitive cytochrome bd-type quinol oxidase subunit II [Roseomonas mucosa]|uniref:Cytochrome d ubiquinol oxidase subunit II n=1 Tax=Roseomonas mucosa TaxID=207340 RepID=A0A1S8D7Y2_9PROT|nr:MULTISPECIES: cytochrome d ubiquinol oxidase subunit II [Roseomonas]MDT8261724.1 cytochrome d ubiquinol oxidase subunit II [Roseomonas sp. DSM 102946]ATR21199.1 cytochrome d ubiquinol oxidase subunit II [Roseomonas sp. FDAARGOS_362]MDT8354697.1 cytochrome d ubiquinol oxidase subunit II [Roseomonas mucosa]ONH83465.1 cytochrome d ubiquinol oxidase subunit II [Roseomonas mucosa]QDJ09146.1 Cyanide-insensitive cytochrome bd-type quinol oxidase subunit II [Roseomonas mucosa]
MLDPHVLAFIWAFLIAVAVFVYVCLDGFDLGVGILFPVMPDKEDRDVAVNSIAPVWDGNETWLVLGGVGLMPAFPLAFSIILPALYMPVILMLLALVFRGVSFEMRFRAANETQQKWWDRAFSWGSYVAAFCQGIALGAFVQGIPVANNAYAGGWWDWLTAFSLFTGLALVTGYGVLGACWLLWKTEGALHDRARRQAGSMMAVLLFFILVVSVTMPFLQPAFAARWLSFPNIVLAAPVPVIVLALAWLYFRAVRDADQHGLWADAKPFVLALGIFLITYVGFGISMYPHIVPPSITIWEAAAPASSQIFLLVGAVVLLPIILGYTGYVYWLFRGKVRAGAGYH